MTGLSGLGPITSVTISTPDLQSSEAAYVEHLGYRVEARGTISPDLAQRMQCPSVAGARYSVVLPAAGDGFTFRFIEQPATARYKAFSCFGWNAAELIVRDVDEMAARLATSPFEALGPPQDLSFTDAIRAMQLRGPAGEILYLTQFKRALDVLPAPPARCDVDRVFIVIVGGPSLDALVEFYCSNFSLPAPQRMESRVKAMSAVFGLSPEHRYSIAALPLHGACYIEADEMPQAATAPTSATGRLPPGIAVVSFSSPSVATPRFLTGAAGEILELVPA